MEGTIALVTGGQRGLGKAFVEELLARGATKVYATARKSAPSDDPRVVPLDLDVTDPASVAGLAALATDVNLLVNNAGITIRSPLLKARPEDVAETFETNVYGVLRVTQAFAPILAANGGGALMNIGSVLSWAAGAGAYGASKAALWSITNTLRGELAAQGTQVVSVHLGYTDTDMTSALDVVKNSPRQVAADALDVLAAGGSEALTDRISRETKAALSGPPEGLAFKIVDGEVRLAGSPS